MTEVWTAWELLVVAVLLHAVEQLVMVRIKLCSPQWPLPRGSGGLPGIASLVFYVLALVRGVLWAWGWA